MSGATTTSPYIDDGKAISRWKPADAALIIYAYKGGLSATDEDYVIDETATDRFVLEFYDRADQSIYVEVDARQIKSLRRWLKEVVS